MNKIVKKFYFHEDPYLMRKKNKCKIQYGWEVGERLKMEGLYMYTYD